MTTNTTFNTIFIPSILKDIPYSIGKNAEHNSQIISLSSSNDLWFHLDNYPSAHVILHIPDGILLNKKNKHKQKRKMDRKTKNAFFVFRPIFRFCLCLFFVFRYLHLFIFFNTDERASKWWALRSDTNSDRHILMLGE